MPIISTDFINFAEQCLARKDEIGFRNAVGRAYYGAYHHVISAMSSGPKDSHKDLISYLQGDAWRLEAETYTRKELLALGYILKAMKDQRTISDYFLEKTVTKNSALIAIKNAHNVIALCNHGY
ncbi:hypothetical protein GKQ23_08760 [Erwinia sp. E602]|uniref:hypothetical protein n=1 Tax=Erwinia sp. E602 TaxID=2675378 RepID=UPI001BA6B02C|nr:hypothetical protein [Erwinia sp. E602]QUG75074.1 hypothetical protein GKQ23_08760 [Erwinia sp. E602]